MIDDDISVIYKKGRRTHIGDLLKEGWREYLAAGVRGILGFKHTTFAIPKSKLTYNTTVAHIVFMNPSDGVQYNQRLQAFEDIDILFKYYRDGLPIMRLNTYVYYTPPSGTSTHGGIDYNNNTQVKVDALKKMAKQYPAMITYDDNNKTRYGQPVYELRW